MRTLEWDYSRSELRMINQRLLPARFEINTYQDYRDVATAIRDMVVRGAPAIGAAAGFGMALAACHSGARSLPDLKAELHQAADVLKVARPTAVNLGWAVRRILSVIDAQSGTMDDLRQRTVDEAVRIADEDVEINHRMARFGSELIQDGDTIIHHCNTGALAVVDWGTALGVIRQAYVDGKKIRCWWMRPGRACKDHG